LAVKGRGPWRLENTDSTSIIDSDTVEKPGYYLSRVQKWCRWHFAVQWPFCLQFHVYYKQSDVPSNGNEKDTDGKLLFIYRGWHRDEDEIFWGDGGFLGTGWK
jgi:hypothetical protein